jgi:hypothetical protein
MRPSSRITPGTDSKERHEIDTALCRGLAEVLEHLGELIDGAVALEVFFVGVAPQLHLLDAGLG